MIESSSLYCSEQMAGIILEGVREVMDRGEIADLFAAVDLTEPGDSVSISEEDLKRLLVTLEQRHGTLGTAGLAVCIGRAACPGIVRTFSAETGFEDVAFRTLPVQRRAQTGLEKMAGLLNRHLGFRVTVESRPSAWEWKIEDNATIRDPLVKNAVLHFMHGLLQVFLSWANAGRVFQVDEFAGSAGDGGVIMINRLPLD